MESNPTHTKEKLLVFFSVCLAGAIFLADSQKCVTARSLLSLKAQRASASGEQGTLREGGGAAVGAGRRGTRWVWTARGWRRRHGQERPGVGGQDGWAPCAHYQVARASLHGDGGPFPDSGRCPSSSKLGPEKAVHP